MSQPVAIVTGAASGMGLALTKHLISKGYKVGMADLDESEGKRQSSLLGSDTVFRRLDVTDYHAQAKFFKEVFEWGEQHLDFLAANAGITENMKLFERHQEVDAEGLPKPLDTRTLDVDLKSVFDGIWLFRYFHGQGKKTGKQGSKAKIVITASSAGLYPFITQPQYTAAKHGLVGLVRCCGPMMRKEGISVNCICPTFVETNLVPPEMKAVWPKELFTPMETIISAFDKYMNDDKLTGQVMEITGSVQVFRIVGSSPDATQRQHQRDMTRTLSRLGKEGKLKL